MILQSSTRLTGRIEHAGIAERSAPKHTLPRHLHNGAGISNMCRAANVHLRRLYRAQTIALLSSQRAFNDIPADKQRDERQHKIVEHAEMLQNSHGDPPSPEDRRQLDHFCGTPLPQSCAVPVSSIAPILNFPTLAISAENFTQYIRNSEPIIAFLTKELHPCFAINASYQLAESAASERQDAKRSSSRS